MCLGDRLYEVMQAGVCVNGVHGQGQVSASPGVIGLPQKQAGEHPAPCKGNNRLWGVPSQLRHCDTGHGPALCRQSKLLGSTWPAQLGPLQFPRPGGSILGGAGPLCLLPARPLATPAGHFGSQGHTPNRADRLREGLGSPESGVGLAWTHRVICYFSGLLARRGEEKVSRNSVLAFPRKNVILIDGK